MSSFDGEQEFFWLQFLYPVSYACVIMENVYDTKFRLYLNFV